MGAAVKPGRRKTSDGIPQQKANTLGIRPDTAHGGGHAGAAAEFEASDDGAGRAPGASAPMLRPPPRPHASITESEAEKLTAENSVVEQQARRTPHPACRAPHAAPRMPHAACRMPHAACRELPSPALVHAWRAPPPLPPSVCSPRVGTGPGA